MRTLLVLALSVPLAGCFSLTAPKPVPEWAMNPQTAEAYPDAQPQPGAAVRQRAPQAGRQGAEPAAGLAAVSTDTPASDVPPTGIRPSSSQPAGLARAIVRRKPTALADDPPPKATNSQARDADVARALNSICRGC